MVRCHRRVIRWPASDGPSCGRARSGVQCPETGGLGERATEAPGGDVIDGWWTAGPHSSGRRPADVAGSMSAGQGEHLGPLALGQPTPDSVRFMHPQRVVPAGRHGRALQADGLGLGLAASPGRPALTLRVKEERAGHAATCRVQLPIPKVRIRSGKAPGVRHVDPLCSCGRRAWRRSMGQVRDERKWFVGPTEPGIGARSTGQPNRARPRRFRAGGNACVVLPLGRIRADLGAVDLQTLEPSRVPDKTLITFFVDLGIQAVIVVTVRRPAMPGRGRCELRHGRLRVSRETLRLRKVTAGLRSVNSAVVGSMTDPDRPSVFDARPVGTRTDGPLGILAGPIGDCLIPSNDRGQVLFTPSAGGVL